MIRQYFQGERIEMYLILAGSLAALLAAFVLYKSHKGAFSRSFGITVLISVALLGGTAVGLLFRDPPHEKALHAALEGDQPDQALAAESRRMQQVIEKYPFYRYAVIALFATGLIAAALFRNGTTAGLATGLLLLLAAQTLVDHYSEARARAYFAALQSRAVSVSPP